MNGSARTASGKPSATCAPIIVGKYFDCILAINERGTTVLLVEQNVMGALEVATRGYVLETGRIVTTGTRAELLASDEIQKAYLCP